MRTSIKNFTSGGSYSQHFNLVSVERSVTSKGSPYMKLSLGDSTGTINGNAWFDVPELIPGPVAADVKVTTYQGQLQVTVSAISSVNITPEELAELVPASPYPASFMSSALNSIIESIADPNIRLVVDNVLKPRAEVLKSLPAAKGMHHNFIYGWLQHTTEMAYTADAMAKIYPVLNRDLLVAGAILHDIGKVEEFNCNSTGLVESYSIDGSMQGHLFIGARTVEAIGSQLLGSDHIVVKALTHMILSHHGNPEWGAVTRPCTPEAEALFLVDMMSSRMEMFRTEYEKLEEGQMADAPHRGLDGVRVFKTSSPDINSMPNWSL